MSYAIRNADGKVIETGREDRAYAIKAVTIINDHETKHGRERSYTLQIDGIEVPLSTEGK